MKILQKATSKCTTALFALGVVLSVLAIFSAPALARVDPGDPGDPTPVTNPKSSSFGSSDACKNTKNPVALKACVQQTPIVHDIEVIINVLSAGIGIVIIGAIIFGGIRYSAAGDNAQATAAAKQHIINALIALVAFIFMFAFLQWLIPGGIFDK